MSDSGDIVRVWILNGDVDREPTTIDVLSNADYLELDEGLVAATAVCCHIASRQTVARSDWQSRGDF